MKLPICSLCAKTGILCNKCREKIQRNEVSETDILVSKHLSSIERKYPKLQKAKLIETIGMDNRAILVVDSKMEEFLKSTPKVQEEVENLLRKKISVIVKAKSQKDTLNSIFSPLEIEGLDTIYIPTFDGQEELKIRLRGDLSQLNIPVETLKEIAARVTGKLIRLELPREEYGSKKVEKPLY